MRTDITWTDTAWARYQDAIGHTGELRAYFGDRLADEHLAEFLGTFNRVTLAAGEVNVQTDGDGFYITTPHIVIGLVWTPDSDEKRKQRLAGAGFHYHNENTDGWPRTGRWSAHS